jgi:hypothetical protein
MKILKLILMSGLAFCLGPVLWAIPSGFNIQGRLTDANGVNKDGTLQIKFSVFAVAEGGAAVWEKAMPTVTVKNGNFQVILQGEGDIGGQLEEAVKEMDASYVEIKVGSEAPMVPRQPLLRSPFSVSDDLVGAVMWFYRASCPKGFLQANGGQINETDFPKLAAAMGKSGAFTLPDLRGEFIRGLDNGRGVDPGRSLGSSQADELKAHSHTVWSIGYPSDAYGYSGGGWFGDPYNKNSSVTGGAESRPRNIALLPCIRY